MPNTDNEAVQTVKVPDWLKGRFGNGLSEYEADDCKKLSAIIKDNSALEMAVADLSDETLDCAATVYCDDWYFLEPEQQQELRENIQDWIGALLVAGAISVSPQSKTEKPFWKPFSECPKKDGKLYFIMMKSGTLLTGRYDHEINEWAGAAASYKKSLFAYYAEIPPLEAE
ncbi:hypothetical protein [Bartonella apis]|uniref:hypothetical protein n=1 Tax=Bartonella apis TaxID=1686310 RepID=UPI00242EDD9E|nr:hypothetical protein [Bartonella apis]